MKRQLIPLILLALLFAVQADSQIVSNGNGGSGGGGGSGTVASGTQGQIGTYASNGTTISGSGPVTGAVKVSAAGVASQAACADLSNGAASCSTDTTNASNISSGTLGINEGGTGNNSALTFYGTPYITSGSGSFGNSANTMNIWPPERINAPTVFSHICIGVATLDASNHYDWGLYSLSGTTATLLADVGAQHVAATGVDCQPIIQNASCTGSHAPAQCCSGSGTGTCPASITITPGLYSIITTADSTTGKIAFNNTSGATYVVWAGSFSQGSTANGILASSATIPSVSPVQSNTVMGFVLY